MLLALALSLSAPPVLAAEPARVEWAATKVPPNAKAHLPALDALLAEMWPDLKDRAVIAAQIEQETCVDTIAVERQKTCWSPNAERKTDREYGFGLGGITVTYDASGAEQLNGFAEVKKLDAKLAEWRWEDRFDAKTQLRAVVALNRKLWRKMTFETADEREKTAFLLAAYSGGLGALQKDRAVCEKTLGCDVKRWFGHVEKHSRKGDYVTQILDVRKSKYESAFTK